MGKRIDLYSAQSVQLVKDSSKVYELDSTVIRSPEDAYVVFTEVLGLQKLPNENFVMLALNTKNKVIGVHSVFVGSVTASVISPREVYQRALLNNATSIIVGHNHPSESIAPSAEDIDATKKLKEAGDMLNIPLLDHIIVGDGYSSLKELGYLN